MLENIFAGLKAYAVPWEVANVRLLNDTEKNLVERAEIVVSDYGYSCCFFMKNGTKTFIPMDKDYSAKGVGELLDIDKIEIVKYVKEGESPINRVREKSSDLRTNSEAIEYTKINSSNNFEKFENIFSGLKSHQSISPKRKTYGGLWELLSVRLLNNLEKKLLKRAEIVEGDYGTSCCFFMKNETKTFLPMERYYTAKGIGETLDIDRIEIVKYVRDGDSPIFRVRERSSDIKVNVDTLEYTNEHSFYDGEMLENIFAGLRHYPVNWEVAGVRSLKDSEKNLIRKAEIISSDYGNSCCFFMKNGTKTFIPMDKDYTAKGVGEFLDLDKIEIVKYVRDGDSPINRIREKQ
jgi:hypothetical protein